MLIAKAVVGRDDVIAASRVVLGLVQRDSYVAWRDRRWYDDEELARRVRQERHEAKYARGFWVGGRVREGDVFCLTTALEVLLAGVAMGPLAVISSLDQLGVHHETSPVEDFQFALELLDRPGLFDPVREMAVPLSEVRIVDKVFGEHRLRMAWRAGWLGDEVLSATYSGDVPDLTMLETLAALRADAT